MCHKKWERRAGEKGEDRKRDKCRCFVVKDLDVKKAKDKRGEERV